MRGSLMKAPHLPPYAPLAPVLRSLAVPVALCIAAGIVLALVTWAKAVSFSRVETLLGSVEERKAYEEQVFETTTHLLEMQTARRAFVLTGDAAAAERFEAGAAGLRARIAAIDRSVTRVFESADAVRWASVRRSLAEYESHLRASIERRRADPADLAGQQEFTRIGEAMVGPVHVDLGELERHVESRFEEQMKALLASSAELQRRDAWLSGLVTLMLLAAAVITLRESLARGRAQRALALANTELEDKVAQRTQALQDSEQRYRQLVELSADALFLCTSDRRVLFANAAALEGADMNSLFAPADNPWLDEWLAPMWKSAHRHGYRVAALRTAGGAQVPVQIAAVSYQTPSGMQAQIVVQDMSQLIQEQAATREQLRFIDQLVDAIPVPLAVRDERGRYLRVNRAYERSHGCSADGVRNRSVFDVLPLAQAQQVAQLDADALGAQDARDSGWRTRVRCAGPTAACWA
jgi:PAS domain S-box-containing protein